jgi:hypothetical protein
LKLRIQFDSQIFFRQGFVNGDKVVVAPAFHRAFPLEVNDHRALFGLEGVVTARGNQAFNDVIERVVVVVEQHHMPLVIEQDIGKDIFLSFNFCGVVKEIHLSGSFVAQR